MATADVILSAAKDLDLADVEILRVAQDDEFLAGKPVGIRAP